jgi:hypothetical protein
MMTVLVAAVGLLVVRGLLKRRHAKGVELKANVAAQQVQSPYAALYPVDRDGLVGRVLSRFGAGRGF